MVDRVINDFVVVLGNDVDGELESFKLFNVVENPRIKNGRVFLGLKARDVEVRKSGGFHFVQTVLGRADLDRKRTCAVDEDLFFSIKDGKPNMFLALPDDWDKLPNSIKNNRFVGQALKMAYLQKKSLDLQAQSLIDAGYQSAEINDILSQSQSKLNDFVMKQFNAYSQEQQTSLEKQIKPTEEKTSERGY